MDSINSFKGYDKFDAGAVDVDEATKAYRRQTRKRVAIIAASFLLLLLIAVAAFVGTRVGRDVNRGAGEAAQSQTSAAATAVKTVCESTRYPATCVYTLLSANSSGERDDPEELLKLSLLAAADELRQITGVPATLLPRAAGQKLAEEAISSCGELLGEAAGLVNRSVEAMAAPGKDGRMLSSEKLDDLRSWLSGALTDHETCLEGLEEAGVVEIRGLMMAALKNSSELTSNSLAIATNIVPILNKLGLKLHRRLLMWVGPRSEVDSSGGGGGYGDGDGAVGGDVGRWWKPSMVRRSGDVGPGSMSLLVR